MKAVVLDLVRIRETARDGHAKIARRSLHIAYWPNQSAATRQSAHIMDISVYNRPCRTSMNWGNLLVAAPWSSTAR